jgi:hypothetical protein
MKKIQEYKRDLNVVNDYLLQNKDDIIIMKFMVDYEHDDTYQRLLKERKDLKEIKVWLENKLQLNLVD